MKRHEPEAEVSAPEIAQLAPEAPPVGESVRIGGISPFPAEEPVLSAAEYARSLGKGARVAGFRVSASNGPAKRTRAEWAQVMADHKNRPVR